jgi:hypothetical protein
MIKFSDFVKNDPKESYLNYDGSFAAIRNNKKESILSWPSSHAEIRSGNKHSKKSIKESIVPPPTDDVLQHTHKIITTDGYRSFDEIHDHPDIRPQKLSQEHLDSIKDYSQTKSEDPDGDGSSKNLNGYLRNRLSNDPKTPHKVTHQHPEDVEFRAKQLMSAFTPENTNRKPVQVFSGIPPSIGNKLRQSSVGAKHLLAGFTSTSTSRETARGFGVDHARAEDENIEHPHIMVCHVEPGAGLSIAKHSTFSENEILLHPGAHVTYRGSEFNHEGIHLHHVTIHNTHKPLDEYPEYKR